MYMFSIQETVRQNRHSNGLTQFELAQRAGISLPCLQNIEAGRGNPELSTLNAIFRVLGLELKVEISPVDWDALAACGAPLMTTTHSSIRATPALLVAQLNRAIRGPSLNAANEREFEALLALVSALQDHFPSFFRKHFKKSHPIHEFASTPRTGRIVKLRRQAIAKLASYL